MKIKLASLCAVFMIALVVVSACGGGGGGSGSTSTPTSSAPVTASVNDLQGTTVSPTTLSDGVKFHFSGSIDPSKTTVEVTVGGIPGSGTATFSNNNQDVAFKPTVRLPFGKSVTVTITTVDTTGHVVQTTVTFTTSAMSCTNTAIWSNPAVFSAALQDCVAPIGVMALVTSSINTLQDNSCTIAVGTALTAACKAYLANGTMLLADTSIVVNGHAVKWMAYIGMDGKSNIVLLDTNDPNATPVPLGTLVLPTNLVSAIGNPTGESIRRVTTSVNGVIRTEQVTWDVSSSSLVVTCLLNCT